MADSRKKTSIQKRLEIVCYCIDHNLNFKKAAKEFNVSYSQVYARVRKNQADGEVGLQDRCLKCWAE